MLVASYRLLTFLDYHQAICSLSHYDERDILNNKYFQLPPIINSTILLERIF